MIQCIFLRFKEIWHSLCKTTLSNEANRKWKKIYIFSFLQPILIIFVSFELSGPLDFTIAEPPKSLLMFFVTKSFLSFCFCWFFPLESFLWPLPLEVEGILKSVEATGVSMKEPTQPHQGVPCINFLPTRYTVVLTFYLKPLNSSCIHRGSMGSPGHPAWEDIYGNKSFLELQSILHYDPLKVTSAIKHKNTHTYIIFLLSLYTATRLGTPTSLLICVQFMSVWEATQIWWLWRRHEH